MVTRRALAVAAFVVLGGCAGGEPVRLTAAGPPVRPAARSDNDHYDGTPSHDGATDTAPMPTTITTRRRPAPKPAPKSASQPVDATRVGPGESMSATFGPRPKGALVFPYQRGRTSWEGVSEGTTLRVRVEVGPAGEATRFFVESDHPRERCSHSVLFGDGFDAREAKDTAAGPASSEFSHAYNRAGRVEFLVQAIVGRCGDHNLYPSLYAWIDIPAGTAPARSQGPQPPTVEALEARGPSELAGTGLLKVWAKGHDDDGYIHRFVIWGDGSPTDAAPNAAYDGMGGCKPTPSGWPGQHEAWLWAPYPEHHYATPGIYTVTVTAVSAGCDGRDEQTASATFAYRW